MESIVRDRRASWKNLKQRLGLKAMGCCGATWSPRARISTISILEEDEDEEEEAAAVAAQSQQVIISRSGNVVNNRIQNQTENSASTPLLVGQQQQQQVPTAGSGMNLAMALAAERNLRTANMGPSPTEVKTLMRLIEETDGVDWKKKRKDNVVNVEGVGVGGLGGGGSCDWMCCVCMERKKGAAFIPCGHAFCRVCSREVWVNRGSCPVCNRSILDILDIF
ncbi:PREDICTED: uncharacterized protein LOC18612357 [Theobroma cacao]|uniref:Uncharacterized protein LOC18612357 n=2 Tax=Theobroma cacao TaxID=3641 RepID=A0AB32VN96_THECC|nr:PREDICTED: uncharacterized protein LOC18612357 [Theobroma cacao]XP_017975864.1 PREDICTED: uncharacterized protein LOC18612357 [Theobroma cacao]XP_017975871.1 PREDICTED: uncharacterized protein LOC18612357 [Theobroma cacao]EOX93339.1 Ubiquitin-protein ligase, putative [Theobroma cacao]